MKAFEEVWCYLQTNLRPSAKIKNWTAFKNGYLGDEMTIEVVGTEEIEVSAPNAKNIQVVPKDDFELVWEVWVDYKTQKVKRYEVRDMTRYSKFIISILHWYDLEVTK